ncbi:MAG: hypothetical protein SNJ78_00955 [Spirochaetales bacterium]
MFLETGIYLHSQNLSSMPFTHGSLDTFVEKGIQLSWGIVKTSQGKSPEYDLVVLRIKKGKSNLEALKIEGIDPFSGNRIPIFSALFSPSPVDIVLPRSHFNDFPRTEIYFFSSYPNLREGKGEWALYYVGVPDTTPEFLSFQQLETYLQKRLP